MRRVFSGFVIILLTVFMMTVGASASNMFPLEPPDTSSPRATLKSFLKYTDMFYQAMKASKEDAEIIREAQQRAERCFDLSQIAPSIRDVVALESVLRLREILDRIPIPDAIDVPDKEDIKHQGILVWRMPHTEIKIGKSEGARLGAYLFTPETVDRLDGYYQEVRHLPYKEDATTGVYEEYIYSSGWLIPDGLIGGLPEWMKQGYWGQAVWQWIGLTIAVLFVVLIMWPMFVWHRRQRKRAQARGWESGRLVFPLTGMILCLTLEYFAGSQINITGRLLNVFSMGMEAAFSLFAAWAIFVAGNVVTNTIIATQNIQEGALNADVIRLTCRLISLTLVFALFYRAGSYFGLPVTAVFASAGVAGVAIALAARETLANFFGGVSIFMDRPFRAGDYIVLESGERGEVKAVGMRSTRLLTRDDILITIPNSLIANGKIVNQSAPHNSFRVRIAVGVAYGSDLDEVEAALIASTKENLLIMDSPEPSVRLRKFGDSSINYELRAWIKQPKNRGRLVHQLSREIYALFEQKGIEIPFPQRDVHIISD